MHPVRVASLGWHPVRVAYFSSAPMSYADPTCPMLCLIFNPAHKVVRLSRRGFCGDFYVVAISVEVALPRNVDMGLGGMLDLRSVV
jgi:hypothetical protein